MAAGEGKWAKKSKQTRRHTPLYKKEKRVKEVYKYSNPKEIPFRI
jgi:hypothetical protein